MNCPFCNIEDSKYLINTELAFAVSDIYPVSKGHTLVIPKIHIQNYFDLDTVYQIECWKLVNNVKDFLEEKYHPKGYNVGLNINSIAGQSVMHAHIHIIPRYSKESHKNFAIENMILK